MAKEIENYVKLQIPAGEANPAPPVGPALGQHGLNIQDFCKSFNAKTEKLEKLITENMVSNYANVSGDFNPIHLDDEYAKNTEFKNKIPYRQAPNWLLKLFAFVRPPLKMIAPELGKNRKLDSSRARNLLGWKPRSAKEAIKSAADSLIKFNTLS